MVGVAGGDGVVGDHDDGLAELVHGPAQEPRISVPLRESRLPVGSSAKTTLGPADERPGHGDPLLLAAGQLGRPVVEPVAEADACR